MGHDGERSGDYHHYVPDGGGYRQPGAIDRFFSRLYKIFDGPVTWFRETIIVPNQQDYNWYHRQFRRVPTIDECHIDDAACLYEANSQFKRDRLVDNEIVIILRKRLEDCIKEEYPDTTGLCMKLKEDYLQGSDNWFSKYGDLGAMHNVRTAFMKQKHRMIWERRHGPIGTGMKKNEFEA